MMIVVDLNAWVESIDPRVVVALLGIMGWGMTFLLKSRQ